MVCLPTYKQLKSFVITGILEIHGLYQHILALATVGGHHLGHMLRATH